MLQLGYKEFSASNGWLDKFKKPNNIVGKKSSGEAGLVDMSTIEIWKNQRNDCTPNNDQLSDEEILSQISQNNKNNNIIPNNESIEEEDEEVEPKQVISKKDFMEMVQKQKDFLLSDENDNRITKQPKFPKTSIKYVSMYSLAIEIKDYFNNSYDLYECLFTSINYEEAYYLCPDRLRLPLIFYYGHTAFVYMNKLVLAGLLEPKERINFEFDTLFETGVDEMSSDDLENFLMGCQYKWPSVEQVHYFRLQDRKLINQVIDRNEIKLPINWDNKLLKLIKAKLNLTNHDFPFYGWDNEYGKVKCVIVEFEASKYKITNEEFYEFVKTLIMIRRFLVRRRLAMG
ncbi:unnamed protein product [Brachionus calyciflorus]|uniref:HTH CENPB-type domain-containing protein n=1 Tax=Brachionus calyciflorus TaxID=104777 RepID=A0A814HMB7_9BILA|nr:unnamed protein product [Brachionus calyciflorus]